MAGLWIEIPDEWFIDALQLLEPEVEKAGNRVADNVTSGTKTTVTMKRDREGRPVALVTLAEAKGLFEQAKNATLTKAAANAGLDVVRYTKKDS